MDESCTVESCTRQRPIPFQPTAATFALTHGVNHVGVAVAHALVTTLSAVCRRFPPFFAVFLLSLSFSLPPPPSPRAGVVLSFPPAASQLREHAERLEEINKIAASFLRGIFFPIFPPARYGFEPLFKTFLD